MIVMLCVYYHITDLTVAYCLAKLIENLCEKIDKRLDEKFINLS